VKPELFELLNFSIFFHKKFKSSRGPLGIFFLGKKSKSSKKVPGYFGALCPQDFGEENCSLTNLLFFGWL